MRGLLLPGPRPGPSSLASLFQFRLVLERRLHNAVDVWEERLINSCIQLADDSITDAIQAIRMERVHWATEVEMIAERAGTPGPSLFDALQHIQELAQELLDRERM